MVDQRKSVGCTRISKQDIRTKNTSLLGVSGGFVTILQIFVRTPPHLHVRLFRNWEHTCCLS